MRLLQHRAGPQCYLLPAVSRINELWPLGWLGDFIIEEEGYNFLTVVPFVPSFHFATITSTFLLSELWHTVSGLLNHWPEGHLQGQTPHARNSGRIVTTGASPPASNLATLQSRDKVMFCSIIKKGLWQEEALHFLPRKQKYFGSCLFITHLPSSCRTCGEEHANGSIGSVCMISSEVSQAIGFFSFPFSHLFGCHVVASITCGVQEHADKEIVMHVMLLG